MDTQPVAIPVRVQSLLAAFEAVNARSPDGVMACWNSDGVYDNPMVGHAQKGYADVRQCMVNLVDALVATGSSLVVDRVTAGESSVVAEWHVEPADGRRGVHVAEFDSAGKLLHVVVFPRAT